MWKLAQCYEPGPRMCLMEWPRDMGPWCDHRCSLGVIPAFVSRVIMRSECWVTKTSPTFNISNCVNRLQRRNWLDTQLKVLIQLQKTSGSELVKCTTHICWHVTGHWHVPIFLPQVLMCIDSPDWLLTRLTSQAAIYSTLHSLHPVTHLHQHKLSDAILMEL